MFLPVGEVQSIPRTGRCANVPSSPPRAACMSRCNLMAMRRATSRSFARSATMSSSPRAPVHSTRMWRGEATPPLHRGHSVLCTQSWSAPVGVVMPTATRPVPSSSYPSARGTPST